MSATLATSVVFATCLAKVVYVGGVPRIAVNGEPISGTAVMPCCKTPPGESVEVLKGYANLGIRLSSDVWTMNDPRYTLKQWWRGEGDYDWELFDRLAHGLLDASKDGYIFPRIKIDPPSAWLCAHTNEMFAGFVKADSSAWRKLYRRMLEDMVRHVEHSDYADRVVGYHIGALSCGEWLIWKFDFEKALPPIACADDIELPPPEALAERRTQQERMNDAIADGLVDAARYLRRLTRGEKLIGAFFGYVTLTHGSMARVFSSGAIDFYAAPPLYREDREPGHAGCSQAFYPASYRLYGAVFFEESDYRTILSDPSLADGLTRMRSIEESDALIRRSIGKCLALGTENWWFLLGGNRTFSHPQLMKSIGTGAAVARQTLKTAQWHPAEVGVFTSANELLTSPIERQRDFSSAM